jgi:predicted nucleotidyltransferase
LAHEYLDNLNNDRELLNYLFETKSLELIQIFKDILDYIEVKMYSHLSAKTQIELNNFMRLSQNQISAILKTKELFFPEAKIYLFGSRVDDTRSGGDIDLYILSETSISEGVKKRIDFLVMLKSLIGDQKIDVVLAEQSQNRLIDRIARQEGVLLG